MAPKKTTFKARRSVGRKIKGGAGKKKSGGSAGKGNPNQSWRAYTTVSDAPIPD